MVVVGVVVLVVFVVVVGSYVQELFGIQQLKEKSKMDMLRSFLLRYRVPEA